MSNQHKPPTTTSSYFPPPLNYHPMQYYLNGQVLQSGQPGSHNYPGMSLFNSMAGSSNALHPTNYAGNAMYTSALANAVPHRFAFAPQNNQDLSKMMAANEQAKMYNTAVSSNSAYLYSDNSQKGNSRPSSPANGGSFKTNPSAPSRTNTPGSVQTNIPSRNNTPGAYSYFGETQAPGEPIDLRLENFNSQNFQSKNQPPTKFPGSKKEADGPSTNVSGSRDIRPHPERDENPPTNPGNHTTPLMLNSLSQDSKTSAPYGADYYKMLSAYPYLPYMMNSQALAPNTASPYAWPLPALASMSGYYPQLSSQNSNLLQLPMGQFALNTQPGFMPQNIWNPILGQVNSGQTNRAVSPARVEAPQMYGQNNGGPQYPTSAQNAHLMSALGSHQFIRSSTPKDNGQSAKSTRLDTVQEPAGNQSPKSTPKRARATNARPNKRAAKNVNGDKDLTPAKGRKRKVAEIEPTYSQAKQQNSASQQYQYGSQNYFQNSGTVGQNMASQSGNVQLMDNMPQATADDSVDYLDSDESIDFSSANKLNHRLMVVNGQVRNQTPNEKELNENANLASGNIKNIQTSSQNETAEGFTNPHVMTTSAANGSVYQESEKFNEQETVEQPAYQNRTNSVDFDSGNLVIDTNCPGSPTSEENYHVPETCEADNCHLPQHPSGADNYLSGHPSGADNYLSGHPSGADNYLSGHPSGVDNYPISGAVTVSSEYYEPPKLLDKDYNIVDITVSKCTDTPIDSSNTESNQINTNTEENHAEYNQMVNQVPGIFEASGTAVCSNGLVCERVTANQEETRPDRSSEVHQHEGRDNSYHPMFYVETNLTENPSFDQPNRVDSPEEVDVYPTKSNQDRVKDVHPYDTHISSTSHSPQYSETKNIQHSAESQNTLHGTESQNTPHSPESQNTPHNTETQNTHSSDEHHTTCHETGPGNSYSPSHQPQGKVSRSVYHFNSANEESRANLNSSPIGNSSIPGISQAEPNSTQGQSRLFGFDVRSNYQEAKTAHLPLENSSQFQYNDGHHGQIPDRQQVSNTQGHGASDGNTQQFSNSHNHGAINLSLENADKHTKNTKNVLPYPSTGMNYPAWFGNPSGLQNLRESPVAPGGQPQPLTDKTNTPEPPNDATHWKHPVAPYMPYPMFNGRNFDFNTNFNLGGNQLQNSYSHYLDYYYNKENIEKNVVDSLTVMEKNKAQMSCSNVLVDKNVVVCQSKLSCSSSTDQTNTAAGHEHVLGPKLDSTIDVSQQTNQVAVQQAKDVAACRINLTELDFKIGPGSETGPDAKIKADAKIGPGLKVGSDANILTCSNVINIKQEIVSYEYSTCLNGGENIIPNTCDKNDNQLNVFNTKHQKSLISFFGNISHVQNTRQHVKKDENLIKQECVSLEKLPVSSPVPKKQTNILTFFSSNTQKNHLANRIEPTTSTQALLHKSEQQLTSLESTKVFPFKEKIFSSNKIHSHVESKPVSLTDKAKVRSYSHTNHSLATGNYSTASRGKQMLMKSREKNLENQIHFPEDLSVFKMPFVGATGKKAPCLKKPHQPTKPKTLKKCSNSVIKCDSQLHTVRWMYGFIQVLNLTDDPATQVGRISGSIGILQDLCPMASLEELGFYTNPMCRGLYFIIKVEDGFIPLKPLIKQFLTGKLQAKKAPTNPTALNIVGTSSGLDLRKVSQGSARTSEYAKLRQTMNRSYCDACGNAYSCSTEQHLNGDKHKSVVNAPGFYHPLDALVNLTGSIHAFINFHLVNKTGDLNAGDKTVDLNVGGYKTGDDKAVDLNVGSCKTGDDKAVDLNVGSCKTGDDKAVDLNVGSCKTGDDKAVDLNVGGYKTGDDKAVDLKVGGYKTGDDKAVDLNVGSCKTGDDKAVDLNVGGCKTGDDKAVDLNVGSCKTGDDKAVDLNVGSCKTGDDKAVDLNVGGCKTGDDKVADQVGEFKACNDNTVDNIIDRAGKDKLSDHYPSETTELADIPQCIIQQEKCLAGINSPECKSATNDITVKINITQTVKSDLILQAPKLNLLNTTVVYRKRTYTEISTLTSDQPRKDLKSKRICCRAPSDQDPFFKLAQDIENFNISSSTNTQQDNVCADKKLFVVSNDRGNYKDLKREVTQLKVAPKKIKQGKLPKLVKRKKSSNPVTFVLISNSVAMDQWSEGRDKNIFLQCFDELKKGIQPNIFQYTY